MGSNCVCGWVVSMPPEAHPRPTDPPPAPSLAGANPQRRQSDVEPRHQRLWMDGQAPARATRKGLGRPRRRRHWHRCWGRQTFVAARDTALIPPWLVKEGRSIVVYDAKGNQITQTVGVAPKTPKVLGMGAAMPGQVGPVLECLTCRSQTMHDFLWRGQV
jgi:hypothetical protein